MWGNKRCPHAQPELQQQQRRSLSLLWIAEVLIAWRVQRVIYIKLGLAKESQRQMYSLSQKKKKRNLCRMKSNKSKKNKKTFIFHLPMSPPTGSHIWTDVWWNWLKQYQNKNCNSLFVQEFISIAQFPEGWTSTRCLLSSSTPNPDPWRGSRQISSSIHLLCTGISSGLHPFNGRVYTWIALRYLKPASSCAENYWVGSGVTQWPSYATEG